MQDDDKRVNVKELTSHRRFDVFVSILNEDIERYRLMLEESQNMKDIISLQAKIYRTRQILHMFED